MLDKETVEKLTAKYAGRIREILSQSELDSITAKKVRSQLELEFQVDLKLCKDEINEVIARQFTALQGDELPDKPASSVQSPDSQGGLDEDDLSDVIDSESRKRKTASKKKESKEKTKKVKVPRKKKPVDPNAPKPTTGIMAPQILSEKLSKLLNADRLSRTEVIKRLWVYIKENKLQDPKDGRKILCNSVLKDLFQVDEVTSFQMAKFIGPHLSKIPPEEIQMLQDQAKSATNVALV